MKAERLIDRIIDGDPISEVLDEAAPPSPFAMRKYIRQSNPTLHKFLLDRGDLHDFALLLRTKNPSVDSIMKDRDIPKQYKHDVKMLIAGLEES